MATVPTRLVFMSTKNLRTDGLGGEVSIEQSVNDAYTLMTVNDYSPQDSDSPSRKAVDISNVRTGDQRI